MWEFLVSALFLEPRPPRLLKDAGVRVRLEPPLVSSRSFSFFSSALMRSSCNTNLALTAINSGLEAVNYCFYPAPVEPDLEPPSLPDLYWLRMFLSYVSNLSNSVSSFLWIYLICSSVEPENFVYPL